MINHETISEIVWFHIFTLNLMKWWKGQNHITKMNKEKKMKNKENDIVFLFFEKKNSLEVAQSTIIFIFPIRVFFLFSVHDLKYFVHSYREWNCSPDKLYKRKKTVSFHFFIWKHPHSWVTSKRDMKNETFLSVKWRLYTAKFNLHEPWIDRSNFKP